MQWLSVYTLGLQMHIVFFMAVSKLSLLLKNAAILNDWTKVHSQELVNITFIKSQFEFCVGLNFLHVFK